MNFVHIFLIFDFISPFFARLFMLYVYFVTLCFTRKNGAKFFFTIDSERVRAATTGETFFLLNKPSSTTNY